MLLLDANVLIGAFRDGENSHDGLRSWLLRAVDSSEPYVIPDVVFSAVIRITTNPRTYGPGGGVPSAMSDCLRFCAQLRSRPSFQAFVPTVAHWNLFTTFCSIPGVVGNHVTDAYLAAAAVDQGAELITADRGFIRYPGLRFRNPLDG